jgi:PhoH-like ATPase
MDKRRIYIPDTNIFLHDSNSIYAFPNELIKIPLEVIEEIDDQKRRVDDVGRNARLTSRMLDNLREKGNLSEGVLLDNGCHVSVEFGEKSLLALPPSLRTNKEDNRILATALHIKEKFPDYECVFITKDINMRIKAEAIGIVTEDFEHGKVELEGLYTGWRECEISEAQLKAFEETGALAPDGLPAFYPNELAIMNCGGQVAHARWDAASGRMVKLLADMKTRLGGIRPLNTEQLFAFELLMNDAIELVTMNGKAGTGKTLLALAAGVELVLEESRYSRLLVSRPVVPLGKDLGFLPGSVEDKLDPWMVPIYDNLDIIFNTTDGEKRKEKRDVRDIIADTPLIQVEALTYIRGRSLPNQYMIVDEAQNLTPHEVKTIVTRAGRKTKVILTGDPYQIDHPYLDSNSNGLNYCVEKFKENALAGHITLMKGERSELAETAAQLL